MSNDHNYQGEDADLDLPREDSSRRFTAVETVTYTQDVGDVEKSRFTAAETVTYPQDVGDVEKIIPEIQDPKMKRILSNRQHARSSYLRKKKLMEDLKRSVIDLEEENKRLKEENIYLKKNQAMAMGYAQVPSLQEQIPHPRINPLQAYTNVAMLPQRSLLGSLVSNLPRHNLSQLDTSRNWHEGPGDPILLAQRSLLGKSTFDPCLRQSQVINNAPGAHGIYQNFELGNRELTPVEIAILRKNCSTSDDRESKFQQVSTTNEDRGSKFQRVSNNGSRDQKIRRVSNGH